MENVQGEPGAWYVRKQRKCAENGKYRAKAKAASVKSLTCDNPGIFKSWGGMNLIFKSP